MQRQKYKTARNIMSVASLLALAALGASVLLSSPKKGELCEVFDLSSNDNVTIGNIPSAQSNSVEVNMSGDQITVCKSEPGTP